MRLMKRVLAWGMLFFLTVVGAAPIGAALAAPTAPKTSASPTPFACTKDAKGKCNQFLLDNPPCVAIGLPIAPGAKNTCKVQINSTDPKTGNTVQITVDGVSNLPGSGGAIINYLRGWLMLLNEAVALVIMLMIIIAGVQYITSLAQPASVQAAKKRLTNAMIALVLWLMMFAVLQFLVPGGIL